MTGDNVDPASRGRKSRLFPLHLTPFEDYMVWDDRPAYPMTFVVRLNFEGSIDRSAIEQSLVESLQRHPLLQANVRRAKGGRDCWVEATDPTITIDWGGVEEPIVPIDGEAIDLRENVGLRIWIRADTQQAIITSQFHHACCDGIGAYQFLGDWLWYYARRVGMPVADELPTVEVSDLRGRGKATYDLDNYRLPDGRIDGAETKQFGKLCLKNMQSVAEPRIPPTNAAIASSHAFPGLCEFEFDKDRYKAIRLVAQERGQSVNELLIERLLVSVRQWNDEHGKSRKGQFCVMMPMDLREPDTRLATAANMVTYSLIRRDASDCIESEQLIDSIRQEMVHIKHRRHRTAFMNFIAYMRKYPRAIIRWIAGHRRLATAILSNTGDPTKRFNVAFPKERGLLRAGNLVLTDLGGVPPMRFGTRLTISVFTYRRVLKICMRSDPNRFRVDQTEALLDCYVESIQRLISEP